MTTSFLIELTVLILAAFLGFEVVSKVPTLLHTPLMSGSAPSTASSSSARSSSPRSPTRPAGCGSWRWPRSPSARPTSSAALSSPTVLQMFKRREPPKKEPEE